MLYKISISGCDSISNSGSVSQSNKLCVCDWQINKLLFSSWLFCLAKYPKYWYWKTVRVVRSVGSPELCVLCSVSSTWCSPLSSPICSTEFLLFSARETRAGVSCEHSGKLRGFKWTSFLLYTLGKILNFFSLWIFSAANQTKTQWWSHQPVQEYQGVILPTGCPTVKLELWVGILNCHQITDFHLLVITDNRGR